MLWQKQNRVLRKFTDSKADFEEKFKLQQAKPLRLRERVLPNGRESATALSSLEGFLEAIDISITEPCILTQSLWEATASA